MSGTPFAVRFTFRTPVALGAFGLLPSLEGLVAAGLTQAVGRLMPPLTDGDEPPALDLPLDTLAPDVLAATLLWPLQPRQSSETPALAPDPLSSAARTYPHRFDHDLLRDREHGGGALREKMHTVTPVVVRTAVAFGRGDPHAVQEALRHISHLGDERGTGFGRLASPPTVQAVSRKLPLICSADGALRRIVPLRHAESLGLDPQDPALRAYVTLGSSRLPLWYRPWWEPCLIPLPLTVRQVTPSKEASPHVADAS